VNIERYVLVGDLHSKLESVKETERLLDWVTLLAVQNQAHLVLMGDLFDTFTVIQLEVLLSYFHAFTGKMFHGHSALFKKPVVLVGNHDGDHSMSMNVLTLFRDHVTLVSESNLLSETVGALPFVRDNTEFVEAVKRLYKLGVRTLFCHQEFKGCELDNGYYSPNGVDPELIPKDMTVYSGHIHKKSVMLRSDGSTQVAYVGTPRHLNRSDVGQQKGVVLLEVTHTNGSRPTYQEMFHPTPEYVAEPFRQITITPDNEDDLKFVPEKSSRTYVDVRGPKDFVRKIVGKIPDGIKVRTFPDSEKRETSVKESDGIPKAFAKYAHEHLAAKGMTKEQAVAVLSKVYDACPSLRG
jgi:DNA repair exonuclease SbcCD nuclease subunit